MNFTTLDTDQDKWQGGNCARSYGGGGMKHNNGMNFTTLDTDQDKWQGGNCARSYGGGGWWYNNCGNVRPTGLHRRLKERRKRSHAAKNIVYYSGGERGNSFDSWKEEISCSEEHRLLLWRREGQLL